MKYKNQNLSYLLFILCGIAFFIDVSAMQMTSAQDQASETQGMRKVYELIEKNQLSEAKAFLDTEEAQKDPEVQEFIGSLYQEGALNFEKSSSKAVSWYQKSASLGNSTAQAKLAQLYFAGNGIEKNNEKGIFWLKSSLDQDNAIALDIMGERYFLDDKDKGSHKKAFELFSRSASKGYPYGRYHLGMAYLLGKGTAKSMDKALTLLKQAADDGVMEAQFDLGIMYINGEGAPKNFGLGAEYVESAAKKGMDKAQYTLGMIYVSYRNAENAQFWLEQAAAQGNTLAKKELHKLRKHKLIK